MKSMFLFQINQKDIKRELKLVIILRQGAQ